MVLRFKCESYNFVLSLLIFGTARRGAGQAARSRTSKKTGDHLVQRGSNCHPVRKAELLTILSGAVGHVVFVGGVGGAAMRRWVKDSSIR